MVHGRSQLDRPRPSVVDQQRRRRAVPADRPARRRSPSLPIVAVCLVAGVVVNVGQVGFEARRRSRSSPTSRSSTRSAASRTCSARNARSSRAAKNLAKVGARRRDRRRQRCCPGSTSWRRSSACRPGRCCRRCAACDPHDRPARRDRLSRDRRVDYVWQRYRIEKSLKMDKKEVKEEYKQQELPAEIKRAQRRRAHGARRPRMMDAVPTADVVVDQPDALLGRAEVRRGNPAPIVVAKGVDQLALQDPRGRTASRRAGRPRPAAGAHAVRDRRRRQA